MDQNKQPQKKVEISVDELKSLISRIDSLEKSNNDAKIKLSPKTASVRTVSIMFIDDKPIIGYVNQGTESAPSYIYEVPDPKNASERVLMVDVILLGDEKNARKLRYLEMLREARREECEITEFKREAWEKIDGEVTQVKLDETGKSFRMLETGAVVPAEVKGEVVFVTVKLPNGKTATFHERYVNIAK